MKNVNVIKTLMIMSTLVLITLTPRITSIQTVNANPTEEITYITLPSNSLPLGLAYDNDETLYVALYAINGLAKVNITAKNVTDIYYFATQPYEITPYDLTIAPDGKVWVCQRNDIMLVYNPATESHIEIRPPLKLGERIHSVRYYNGFIWTVAGSYILKVNYTTFSVVNEYFIGELWEGMFMVFDGDILWVTVQPKERPEPEYIKGWVLEFNMTSWTEITRIAYPDGLDRPLGITVSSEYVYVAENKVYLYTPDNGTIARIDRNDYTIIRLETAYCTNEGPYWVYYDVFDNLWWSDGSRHIGVFSPLGNYTLTAKPYNLFMTRIATEVWFSAQGSADIGIVDEIINPDLTGDKIVDIDDVIIPALAFATTPGDPRWNEVADVNKDGLVDIDDVIIIALKFGTVLP
jgi:hypothetical protein